MRTGAGRWIAVACVVVFVIAGTACGGSKSGGSVACATPVSTTSVTIVDYAFNPSCTAATSGATLTLKDTGAIAHTFTVHGTSIDVAIASGETKQVPLTGIAPGTYEVVCTLHPTMTGALRVG
jgi:plastocyanin